MWLETNKIKRGSPANFKNITAQDWIKHFEDYKKALGCPAFTYRIEEVEWILGYVLQQEYSSKSKNNKQILTLPTPLTLTLSEDVYTKHAVENIKSISEPNVVAENPLDRLDCKYWYNCCIVASMLYFFSSQ